MSELATTTIPYSVNYQEDSERVKGICLEGQIACNQPHHISWAVPHQIAPTEFQRIPDSPIELLCQRVQPCVSKTGTEVLAYILKSFWELDTANRYHVEFAANAESVSQTVSNDRGKRREGCQGKTTRPVSLVVSVPFCFFVYLPTSVLSSCFPTNRLTDR